METDASAVALLADYVLDISSDPVLFSQVQESHSVPDFSTIMFNAKLCHKAGISFDNATSDADEALAAFVHRVEDVGRMTSMRSPYVIVKSSEAAAPPLGHVPKESLVELSEFPFLWWQAAQPDEFIAKLLAHIDENHPSGFLYSTG